MSVFPVLQQVSRWIRSGRVVALATVVDVQGSSPREVGSLMAVNDQLALVGSVSGGCVEAAVVEAAQQAILDGQACLLSFGPADDLDLGVGLTCGGTIQVWVERLDPEFFLLWVKAWEREDPLVIGTVLSGTRPGSKLLITSSQILGSGGTASLDPQISAEARALLTHGQPRLSRYRQDEGEDCVFLQPFLSRPHLILLGAVEVARALCQLGSLLGYRVSVCDARAWFATPERFPAADEVVVEWPHQYLSRTLLTERTVILVLTHDPKFDVPALEVAVHSAAAYIGAMGSRQAQADRVRRLQEAGLTQAELHRISAPLGLDIGATTPEETAISILAEVIALRSGRKGGRLTATSGSIHPSPEVNRCPR